MKHSYSFEYLRVVLKPLEYEDIEKLRVLRNKESKYFLNSQQISSDEQQKWYERYLAKTDDIMFKVEKATNPGEFIGTIAVYDINWNEKIAECGRLIIDKEIAPDKGIGADTIKAICKFCFDNLKLKKVIAVVLKSNTRILKIDQRVGFKVIGDYDEKSYLLEITEQDLA